MYVIILYIVYIFFFIIYRETYCYWGRGGQYRIALLRLKKLLVGLVGLMGFYGRAMGTRW